MKYIKLILPSIICLLVIYVTRISIWYYPLLFGVVIGVINWKKHKYKPFIGVFISVLLSLLSFWLAYFSLGLFSWLKELLLYTKITIGNDSAKDLSFLISIFVIAPLLVFYSYKFVFNIPKRRATFAIIIVSILLLVLQARFFYYNNTSFFEEEWLNKNITFVIWQFIMALAIQLILYQNDLILISKFKKRRG